MVKLMEKNKDSIVSGIKKYHYSTSPKFKEDEDILKLFDEHEHYQVGSSGMTIIKGYEKEFPYSVLFVNEITHSFKSLDDILKWNLENESPKIRMFFEGTVKFIKEVELMQENKDLIVDGMIQYHYKNMPRFSEEEVTKFLAEHKHYQVGSSGIYIVKDYDKKFPYSNLFGNVITHSFESLDAMKKWNLECNALMIYMQFALTIDKISEAEVL